MILNSFNELRAVIDRILIQMPHCTPEQTYQIERQVRSAHAYLVQRDVPPQEVLDRVGHMASMAAIQLEIIACDKGATSSANLRASSTAVVTT
jgi:hypothetical protein